MTFAPQTLRELDAYLKAQGVTTLGIVGDTAHQTTGTSYHLGQSQLKVGAYSTTSPRDREPALTEAASAIDIGKVGGTLKGLQTLSNWLARECVNRAVDTLDIREVIWSPDGVKVERWDREGIPPATGSSSHLTHTHVSFYRDSEGRSKLSLFQRYFEGDEVITAIVGADWTPTVTNGKSNGVLRRVPSRSADLVRDAAGNVVRITGTVRTIAEVKANGDDWRLTEYGTDPAYFLATDLSPIADSTVDQQLNDFLNRVPAPVDTTPFDQGDIDAEVAALNARIDGAQAGGAT